MNFSNWLKSGLKTPNYVSGALVLAAAVGMLVNLSFWGAPAMSNNITPLLALLAGAGAALFMLSQARK